MIFWTALRAMNESICYPSAAKDGGLRKLDPLVKIEHIVSCLRGRNLLVDHLSLRIRFLE